MKLLLHTSEQGVKESWKYKVDVIPSVTNFQQRISLNAYPIEVINLENHYDRETNLLAGEFEIVGKNIQITALRDIILAKGEFTLPLWQYRGEITSQTWTTGTQVISVGISDPFWSYAEEKVLLYHTNGKFYVAEIQSYGSNVGTINFESNTGLTNDFIFVVPLRDAVAEGSDFTFGNSGVFMKAGLSATLLTSKNRKSLGNTNLIKNETTYAIPIFDKRKAELEFEIRLESGIQFLEGDGFPFYVTYWKEPSFTTDVFIQGYRNVLMPYLRGFFEVVKTSKGFWLPSRNNEFQFKANLSNSGVLFEGIHYYEFWRQTNLKALAVHTDTDVDIVRVVDCQVDENGNSLAIFNKTVNFEFTEATLCFYGRVNGDITFTHANQITQCEFKFESLPINFYLSDIPDPIVWYKTDDPSSEITAGEFVYLLNKGTQSPNSAFLGNLRPNVDYWVGKISAMFNNGESFEWQPTPSFVEEPNFTINFRYEYSASQTNRTLVKIGSVYEISVTGSTLLFKRGGREITLTSPFVVGNKYTIQHICTNSLDEAFINGVSVGFSNASLGSISSSGLKLQISSDVNARGASGMIPEFRVYTLLTEPQRNIVKSELELTWPDEAVVAAHFDGSADDCEFGIAEDSGAQIFMRVYDKGVMGGYYQNTTPNHGMLIYPINGLIAPLIANTSRNLIRSGGAPNLDFVWKNTKNWLLSIAVAVTGSLTPSFDPDEEFENGDIIRLTSGLFRIHVDNNGITVRIGMASGTFSGKAITDMTSKKTVIEVEYTAGVSPVMKIRVDNDEIGTITPSVGATFSTASGNNVIVSGSQIAVLEWMFRQDHVSQYNYLNEKWFTEEEVPGDVIPYNAIVDEIGDVLVDELGNIIVDET